ncbi:hypothetical protein ABW21_db0201560 [Orbilia brochopaga]|nr:hypothetical protein ABW21_db0201560 [Drechslerella brochopaga]
MASEYEIVRSKILSSLESSKRRSLADIDLTPTAPVPINPPPVSQSPSSTLNRFINFPFVVQPSFVPDLARHVKNLSGVRISHGFIHLHPSSIHGSAYLPEAPQQYRYMTDLFRRIDINIFNVSSFRLETFLAAQLTRVIHGSTALSHTGTDHATTSRICHGLFAGAGITELNLPSSPGFRAELDAVTAQGRRPVLSSVLCAREAVVRYTRALVYLVQRLVCDGDELTQELIKNTHRLLVRDHEPVDDIPWENFGGWYCDYSVSDHSSDDAETATITPASMAANRRARDLFYTFEESSDGSDETLAFSSFLRRERTDPRPVEAYMENLLNSYHEQLELDRSLGHGREATQSDPLALIAWLCSEFMQISPFLTANKEISRIILTGALLKELGIVAVIGDGGEAAREEYRGVLERCKARHACDEEDDGDENYGASYAEFAGLVARKAERGVEEFAAMAGNS